MVRVSLSHSHGKMDGPAGEDMKVSRFEEIFCAGNYPVEERLLGYLNVADLCCMRRVSRSCHEVFGGAVEKGRQIGKLMKRFGIDWEDFRGVLRVSGAVVSGGVATQFFSGVSWPGGDMDIFVSKRKWEMLDGYFRRIGFSKVDRESHRRRYNRGKVS